MRLFEYDDRTGAELCRARDYRAASEHWDALIEDDWRAAVTDRMLLRRRECSLLSGLLKRAEQGVFEASGKTVELLWSGTISVNGVLAAGADPLRRGFELRERGKPKWRFVLVPGALEAGGVDPGRSATVVAQLRGGAEECTVCLEVLEDPVATVCGHVYCLECISSVLQAAAPAGAGPCPTCRQPVQRKALLSLKVVFGRIVVLEIEAPNLLANVV